MRRGVRITALAQTCAYISSDRSGIEALRIFVLRVHQHFVHIDTFCSHMRLVQVFARTRVSHRYDPRSRLGYAKLLDLPIPLFSHILTHATH